jgi:hypothetical protein
MRIRRAATCKLLEDSFINWALVSGRIVPVGGWSADSRGRDKMA